MEELFLEYPPSVNTYWRNVRGRTILSKKAKEYSDSVLCSAWDCGISKTISDNVFVEIDLYPPDRRKRDLDNTLKAIFDGLQKSGVISDDSIIKKIMVEMHDFNDGIRSGANVRINKI